VESEPKSEGGIWLPCESRKSLVQRIPSKSSSGRSPSRALVRYGLRFKLAASATATRLSKTRSFERDASRRYELAREDIAAAALFALATVAAEPADADALEATGSTWSRRPVREFASERKLVAAICHPGWIAISAGIDRGVRVTARPASKTTS
jgi:hypothetical protein